MKKINEITFNYREELSFSSPKNCKKLCRKLINKVLKEPDTK